MSNLSSVLRPRIGYDARLSLGSYRGMGSFLRRLIEGREKNLLGFCAEGEKDSELSLVSGGTSNYLLWEQLYLPRLLSENNIEIFIAPYNTAPLFLPKGTRLVLILHDLIFMKNIPLSRSIYQNAGRFYRRMIAPRVLKNADFIVTVSQATANEIVDTFDINPRNICVVPNSISSSWFDDYYQSVKREDYIFMVSGEAPSKNLKRAIEAYIQLLRNPKLKHIKLKIAGVKPSRVQPFQAMVEHYGATSSVEFIPYLVVDELRSLYRRARLFVMPSLYEGFGIPLLEAMSAGVPAIASAIPALQEVGGAAAMYFDPMSVKHLEGIISEVLLDPAKSDEMIQLGKAQSLLFHPKNVKKSIDEFWIRLEGLDNLSTR